MELSTHPVLIDYNSEWVVWRDLHLILERYQLVGIGQVGRHKVEIFNIRKKVIVFLLCVPKES